MTRAGRRHASKVAISVAAIGVATTLAGVAATQPASLSASPVDLAALIVVGSSTNPSGAGVENFFHGKFNDPIYTGPTGDDITYVNFFDGPQGIKRALEANSGERNAVIASGWGAANLSLLLLDGNLDLSQTVLVMDNDVAGPDGGFGTRYPWFTLIGVNPFPTPSDTGAAAAVDTSYEYDYNSSAPAGVLNPVAAVNSLVAYLYRHLNQNELNLPVNADGTPTVTCGANTCAVTESGAILDCTDARCSSPEDRITSYVTVRGGTTYVTYTSDGLPLTNLIRQVVPFGDRFADLTEPVLKLIVDSAYYDSNPIPKDPSAYRPVRLVPSPAQLLATAVKIPGAIAEGLAATTRASKPSTAGVTSLSVQSDTDEISAHTDKPKTNVVRNSAKTEPDKTPSDVDGASKTEPVESQGGSTLAPKTQPSQNSDTKTDTPAPDATPSDGASTDGQHAAAS
jgi:PE-PPE domain